MGRHLRAAIDTLVVQPDRATQWAAAGTLDQPLIDRFWNPFFSCGSDPDDSRFFEDTGATEIQLLFVSLTGGNRALTTGLTVGLVVMGIIAMALIFRRKPADEHLHFAILSLFSLWSVYHRTYDAVLCVIPAALLIDFVVRRRHLAFSAAALGGLSLLALSLPGLLTERLGLKAEVLSHNVLGFVGLHLERFIILGLFCGLLVVLTVTRPAQTPEPGLARVH